MATDFHFTRTRSEAFAEDLDGLVAGPPKPASASAGSGGGITMAQLVPPLIALLAVGLAAVPVLV